MRKLIKADGTEQTFDAPQPPESIHGLIGAETTDSVALYHMGRRPLHVMVVDDMGWNFEQIDHGLDPDGVHQFEHRVTTPRKPVNLKATELYRANCRPGVKHQIVGDVYIAPDEEWA